jgi:hypothetical protein
MSRHKVEWKFVPITVYYTNNPILINNVLTKHNKITQLTAKVKMILIKSILIINKANLCVKINNLQ